MAQYTATWPILDLCMETEQRPETQVYNRWWKQAGIDLVGVQKSAIGLEGEGAGAENVGDPND